MHLLKRVLFHNTSVLNRSAQQPFLFSYPMRQKIWISKNELPKWDYAEQSDLVNVELVSALDKLKPLDKTPPPFLIVDLRENHERELMDLPKYTKNKALIPRVNIPLDDLMMGYYPDKIPKDRYLVLLCDKGLKSGRAADFLKRNGYSIKILIGGLETLDTLIDLEFNDPFMR